MRRTRRSLERLLAAMVIVVAFAVALDAETAKPAPATGATPEVASTSEAGEPDAGASKGRKQPKTLLEFAMAGGWMMLPLGLASVAWVAFLAERVITLRRKNTVPVPLTEGVAALVRAKPFNRASATTLLDANPSSAARVLRAALDRLDLDRQEIEKGVNGAAQREIYLLRRNIWIFAVVSSAAPLLGLLGTAVGLVQAFREVAISGLGSGANLAPGLYEALVTTIGGLAVAIPAIITYYWLHACVDHYVHEMDCLATDLVEAGTVDAVSSRAVPAAAAR
jgi:biopolymer transport protein ExbB